MDTTTGRADRIPVSIEDEMRQSYMDYAMSVIVGRALPDARDGLKPVHRRALFTMHDLSNEWNFEDMVVGDAKWQTLSDADLFILPSHSENFGIVVAEALVSGTPVITTTATPWAELPGQRCGWCVDPTVAAIMEALKQATELSAPQLDQMGQTGARWAQQQFAWNPIARQMEETYQWMVESSVASA